MRRDEPNRHGRAADAVIASYLRELLAEDETDVASSAALPFPSGESAAAAITSSPDTGSRIEAAL
jgi:hypothetical protein